MQPRNPLLAITLIVALVAGLSLAVVAVDEPDTAERAQAYALALAAAGTPIGSQHGCTGATNRLRRLDPGGTNASRTGAYDRLERTCIILARDHDAGLVPIPPPPVTTTAPPPTTTTVPPPPRLAPQTYNRGSSGQDARYCVLWPGVSKVGPNRWRDEGGFEYDDGGLSLGGRSGNAVAGLLPADSMDGREACDPVNGMPPYPAGSFLR